MSAFFAITANNLLYNTNKQLNNQNETDPKLSLINGLISEVSGSDNTHTTFLSNGLVHRINTFM